jgi:hypothetical protein
MHHRQPTLANSGRYWRNLSDFDFGGESKWRLPPEQGWWVLVEGGIEEAARLWHAVGTGGGGFKIVCYAPK